MKNLLLTVCAMLLSVSIIQAQETKEKKDKNKKHEKVQIVVKGEASPDIYVDGKKFEFDLNLLDPDKIQSINVIKGEAAIKEYDSANGVILIVTKNKVEVSELKTVKVVGYGKQETTDAHDIKVIGYGKQGSKEASDAKVIIRSMGTGNNIMDGEKAPMIIIDGIKSKDKDVLNKISPDDIESISIIKDETAKALYNASNGVIIITTKEGAKKKK